MSKSICIHGHFYQPERSNPWTEAIERQPSASPFNDWNERVTAECYTPNISNYSRISFDFGPTLLAWLEKHASETYRAILAADVASRKRFSGHGSALAQCYHHVIMPLANSRDKYTQASWGVRDFEHRFGRKPEGMWLPELAVDLETLEILAELGINYIVLAPHQAARIRRLGESSWQDVREGNINVHFPYRCTLPSNRQIAIFFYHNNLSLAASFESLKGEALARRLTSAFDHGGGQSQLVHIATDGEVYGHHHRGGEVALAQALSKIQSDPNISLTNYGEFLEKNPPLHEVEIRERSAWSCAHGVERWRSNCGCKEGVPPQWTQEWRAPLRAALEEVRDTIAPGYQNLAGKFLLDPWGARNAYVSIICNRSPEQIKRVLREYAKGPLTAAEKVVVLKLLEIQRHAMLMFTSCGWFFGELSRVETVQLLQHAARVVELSAELFGTSIELRLLELLKTAKSNLPDYLDGSVIYEKLVRNSICDSNKVAMLYATECLEGESPPLRFYCWEADLKHFQAFENRCGKMVYGQALLSSVITTEIIGFTFTAARLRDGGFHVRIQETSSVRKFQQFARQLEDAWASANEEKIASCLTKPSPDLLYSSFATPAVKSANENPPMNTTQLPHLPELIDDLPNFCGWEEHLEVATRKNGPIFLGRTPVRPEGVQAAFSIALHMHQPLIVAGSDLKTSPMINNLQLMMENQHVHGNHDAPVFAGCYNRIADFIRELVDAGQQPRVMLDYSGCLLFGLRQMGRGDILENLKTIVHNERYWPHVEWLGSLWGHSVAPSTPVPDLKMHMLAWQHHFAAIFGWEAVTRVRGFSPPEMHLPNDPDVCYEYVKALKECGYQWLMVQEHSVEELDGQALRERYIPRRLVARNGKGEEVSITALIKTQGSDTKLVAQMQPYHEAKGQQLHTLKGKRIPTLALQISDGENGGVMMNEFPSNYKQVWSNIGTEGVVGLNGTEYLELVESLGVKEADFPAIQPVNQHFLWKQVGNQPTPERVAKAIEELKKTNHQFHMEGGSWTNNLSWISGYENVLDPMNKLSALFHEKLKKRKPDLKSPAYRKALLHLLVSQTSCYRYWGQGRWTEYAQEICRRGTDILEYDF